MRVLLLAFLLAPWQDVEALLKSARGKAARGDYAGAATDYTKALAQDPKLGPALVGRAEARRELKDLDGALGDLESLLELDPRDFRALALRGACRADKEEHAAAVADYTRAIELGADGPLVYALRGFSRASLERYEEAVPDLDRGIAGGYGSAQIYVTRGWARMNLLDFRGAVSDATRSLQKQPRSAKGLAVRGLAYFALGSWANALRDLRQRVEILGSRSVADAIWIYVARRRLGEHDPARAELKEFLGTVGGAAPPAVWGRALLGALLGDRSEEEFLREAGDDRTRTLDANLYLGFRRILDGGPEEAAARFERAAGDARDRIDFERIVARVELDRIRFERRKVALDELEATFRAQKPFRAEFKATGLTGGNDGKAVSDFVICYDRAAPRLQVILRGRDVKAGRDWEGHVVNEGMVFYTWGIERALKVDATAFFRGMEHWDREIRKEVDQLLPPPPGREPDRPMEPNLTLDLEAKRSKDHEGTFRFAAGLAGRPGNWLRDPRRPMGVEMKESEREVTFEFPAARKRIVVDRATGFLRSLRVVDFDDTVREITVTSFRTIDAFPDEKRPATFESVPLDLAQLEGRWKEQVGWLELVLGEALDRWDDLTRAGRQKEMQAVMTRWAARYADSMRTFALRSLARAYVRRRLDQGTPLADLAGEADRFAEAFQAQKAEVERFLRSRLEGLASDLETRAIEAPIDSRRHGALAELLKDAFEFRAVEAEREKAYGDKTGEAFKEELDSQRKL